MAVRQTIASANNRAARPGRRRLLMGRDHDNPTGAFIPSSFSSLRALKSPERTFTETAVAASTCSRMAVVILKRSRRALRFESPQLRHEVRAPGMISSRPGGRSRAELLGLLAQCQSAKCPRAPGRGKCNYKCIDTIGLCSHTARQWPSSGTRTIAKPTSSSTESTSAT